MGSLRLFYAICAAAATLAAAFSPPNLAPPSDSVRRGRNLADRLFSGAIDDFDDFADFSSTQLAPSDVKKGGGVAGGDDPFLSSLQSRLKQVQERSDKLVSAPPRPTNNVNVERTRASEKLTRMPTSPPNGDSHLYASACAPRSP